MLACDVLKSELSPCMTMVPLPCQSVNSALLPPAAPLPRHSILLVCVHSSRIAGPSLNGNELFLRAIATCVFLLQFSGSSPF